MKSQTAVRYAAVAVALGVAASPIAAGAQQSAEDLGRSAIAESSQSSWPTVGSVDTLLSSIDLLGSAALPAPPGDGSSSSSASSSPIGTIGESPITESRIVSVENDRLPRLERWTVASPAMGRNVEVQILRPGQSTEPTPMLYLLDGVDAPRDSGWLHEAHVDERFADENVTLVMPTGAYASMYADWYADDPVLGH